MRWPALGLLAVLLGAASNSLQPVPASTGSWSTAKLAEAKVGVFRCTASTPLLIGRSLAQAAPYAVRPLQERLAGTAGVRQDPAVATDSVPHGPFILADLVPGHELLRDLAARMSPDLPPQGLGDEGYLIEVTSDHVLIAAEKPAGVFYGALALLGRASAAGGALEIPAGRAADWPAMRWRGLHLMVSSRASLPALERILTEVAPRYRINQVILEVDFHYRFRSHPEVAEKDSLTLADCRHLRALADRIFVRLIPELNCLGHQSSGATTGGLLRAHPEFDETPGKHPRNKGIYCRSWCPSDPRVNRVVFDLMDELIDAFRADAFHVGMDEVFILGECPRCKGQSHARLFARAVKEYHRHLVGERGVQMMMWGDRLLDMKASGYSEWDSSRHGTAPAIDLVPKDIVICDWHYGEMADYPSVRLFQEKGFRVWPAGWKPGRNARLLMDAAGRGAGERMMGYLATTWVTPEALVAGLDGDREVLQKVERVPGVIEALSATLPIAWHGFPREATVADMGQRRQRALDPGRSPLGPHPIHR